MNFKRDTLDPTREIVQWERKLCAAKRKRKPYEGKVTYQQQDF